MKKLLLLSTMVWAFNSMNAQTFIDPSAQKGYDDAKAASVSPLAPGSPDRIVAAPLPPSNSLLTSCYFGPNNTYSNFPGNDDGSIGPIALPFAFNLYGTNYTSCYINNNGNITFNGPYGVYSASGFPFSVPMVAPFWADVDTRCGATVKYKVNPTNLIVTWPGVGVYSVNCGVLNTFQLIISNGMDPLIGIGNNVCFYYGDMQWTTGTASGGSGGFGGTPATVGINKGNGINYVQIGRFGINSSAYDGGGGATDGVNYLDNQCFCFNVSNASNIPPSAAGFPAGNILNLPCGQSQNLAISFNPPEVNQNVTVSVNTGGLCGVTYTQAGNGTPVATVNMIINGQPCNQGTHVITFTATDNFNPAGVTTVSLTVNVGSCCIPPVISCPVNIAVPNTTGQCGANVNFAATATGTSPTITYSHAPGSFFPVGTTTVTATATNACGTQSCNFTVTVTDDEAPSAVCNDVSVVLDDLTGTASITAADVNGGSGDNCGLISMSVSPSTFNCSNQGNNTVTLTVTDGNENSSTCNATVNVVSTLDVTLDDDCISITTGYGPVNYATLSATATGGGGGYTYTWSDGQVGQSVTVSPTSTTTYSVTVTDANGCTASVGVVTVIVTDVTDCHPSGNKVQICHIPPGNPANAHEICISPSAIPAHFTGGPGHDNCYLGPCNDPCGSAGGMNKISNLNGKIEVSISPNPSSGIFMIDLLDSDFDYEVWSAEGRLIKVVKEVSGSTRLDLSNEPAGIYLVRVNANGQLSTHKLVKE